MCLPFNTNSPVLNLSPANQSRAFEPFEQRGTLAAAAVNSGGGWLDDRGELSPLYSPPRRLATSPRSPLPATIPEQEVPAATMSQHGSISSSSHESIGELATPDAELSELEQRKVVVLGVPWQTDDSTLQQHFCQFGLVDEAQIMREKYTGKSRGFGFVTFRSTTDALQAVNAEHCIDGRKCEAKFALPEGKVGSARTTRIFVARIPSSVSDPQFRQYFEQFGICQDCYMPKDPSKQGHRGIGFVTYSSPESVELVMSQTHVLNGNEIAIDRATPKEKTTLLPGRLSMSQPNLQQAGGSSHGSSQYGLMRGMPSPASPPSLSNGLLLGMSGRQMSHPALPLGGSSGLLGGSPGHQMHLLQGNGSSHGGSSYHGGGSYHGSQPMAAGGGYGGQSGGGSYHGAQIGGGGGGSYGGQGTSSGYGGQTISGGYGGQAGSGNYGGQSSSNNYGGQSSGGGYSSQTAGGSYHSGHQFGGGAVGTGDSSFHGGQASSSSFSTSLPSVNSFGSAGMNISLLAQAQAAALQQQLSSSAGQSLLDSSSPSQLISLLSANSAAAAAANGAGLGRYGSGGQTGNGGAASSQDLASLLGQSQEQCVHGGGWLRGSLPNPAPTMTSNNSGSLGPASARAGPRIFIGKLNKDTSEQDVKDHFMRFGFVLDVYLPRDKNNKREHRGFGFVTFETEAAIQRVVAHGPHHIKGSIVAIDSAVPRQEEVVLSMDGHSGLAVGSSLSSADRETAEAIHAMEVLSLEGSGRGRSLLGNALSGDGVSLGQPY